jgi:hypothetical protein
MGLLGATGWVVMRLPTEPVEGTDLFRDAQVPTALFALKAGVLLGRAELGIELAPFTQLYWYIPTAEAHLYGGYHLRLSEKVSWPVRAGLGVLIGAKEPRPDLYARVDLVGLSIRTGSTLIDVHLSSVRFTPLPAIGDRPDGYIVSWLMGVGVSWPL